MALHKTVQNCLYVGEREGISTDTTLHRGEEAGDSCRRLTLGLLSRLYCVTPNGNGVDSPRSLSQRTLLWWVLQAWGLATAFCCSYTLYPITRAKLLRGEAINVE